MYGKEIMLSYAILAPCRLYKSLGDYDVLRGIFKSTHVGTKGNTREALEAEERADYMEALRLYKEVCVCWKSGE